jgi:hypothetical protein
MGTGILRAFFHLHGPLPCGRMAAHPDRNPVRGGDARYRRPRPAVGARDAGLSRHVRRRLAQEVRTRRHLSRSLRQRDRQPRHPISLP